MKKIFIVIIFLVGLIIIDGFFINPKGFKIVEKKIFVENLPESFENFKILQISDLLISNKKDINRLKNIKAKSNERKPDIIVFTGDLINSKNGLTDKDINDIIEILKSLDCNLYKYSVIGDSDQKNIDLFNKIMNNSDFIILDNESTYLFYKDITPIKITGINTVNVKPVETKEELTPVFNLVLMHYPDYIDDLSFENTIALSGHSLKGTIRIPFYGGIIKKDGAKKYLFDVLDGNAIESVLMQYKYGKTICVSSQIGCKMGCKFCASTGIAFVRGLTSGEIVEQILAVEQDIGEHISNIVFMGIGEPFDNYDNVMHAIRIINNQKGLNIGARHISVSTSGLVPRIYDFANEDLQCTLSISLHATDNTKRSAMMPVNNLYSIEELMEACKYYIAKTNKRISFEYALAKDNNDNLEDAKALVNLLKGMLCHVNLIPINKIENGKFTKSSNDNIIKFRDYLNDHGIVATIRRELGSDIDAACGQLRRKNLKT
mgnify:CR=1 FL=1